MQAKLKPVFVNLTTEVGATEAEEIGVEHLLRDVKDATVSSLSTQVEEMVTGLTGLKTRLLEVQEYLRAVVEGKMPVNNEIIKNLQDIFSLLPNLNVEEVVGAFANETNDMMMAVYMGSLVRSVVSLHSLIENKAAAEAYVLEQVGALRAQADGAVNQVDSKLQEMPDLLLSHHATQAQSAEDSKLLYSQLEEFAK